MLPILNAIDIFSFIWSFSQQTNYIINFFLLKVLYLACQRNMLKTRKRLGIGPVDRHKSRGD